MAPRTKHEPKKHHHTNPGARDGQYLHAHTGAGVNKPRSVSGRGNSRISHTRIPEERVLEHLKIHNEHHHGKGDGRNGTGKLHTQHHRAHLPNDTDRSDSNTTASRVPIKKHTSNSTTINSPNISTSTVTRTRTPNLIPLRPLLPPRRRPIDPVKRAFTNANLRAIMADKPWPKQRKKASAEKMVLKMGIKKEYK
ncbi:hypothetical protein COCMIDRAFT_2035 [Bipolaris oryzae ATCC 44560]|uniref:Uncharacterized protein n=1 Tax=Bipolaris oryzae ATCC 44560 TaxID=930090 RepID=W6ZZN0_COCMI|nr:uncharacterized protein COCMIDRAFT_2035 [Bipolaris oryzae ATCC 44560]EUC49176.1 hypothetical protein COCMIDRAFT_2035 [Bipolaris oryzae ATCC 44560]